MRVAKLDRGAAPAAHDAPVDVPNGPRVGPAAIGAPRVGSARQRHVLRGEHRSVLPGDADRVRVVTCPDFHAIDDEESEHDPSMASASDYVEKKDRESVNLGG